MTEPTTATTAERIAAVREQIAAACARAGRPTDSVTLIAVSKTHPAPALIEAAAAGIRHFGENRVEETAKIALVEQTIYTTQSEIAQVLRSPAPSGEGFREGAALTWHMIGHVQSRKVREVLSYFQWIHSLDSVKLAERFARLNAESSNAHPLTVLLEMNVSGEASKEGIAANRWQDNPIQRGAIWDEVRAILALPGLQVRGLMTVAPIVEDMQAARPVFAALRTLRDALATDFPSAPWDVLSMGMTDDYPVAIEEGATHIRVGRAIFGERMRIES